MTTPGTDRPSGERILVVDDEPDIVALVAYHLAKAGYRVSTASGGADAIEVAQRERPALVVLDLMLPDRSGYDVLEQLRGDDGTHDVAVLLLTARREEPDRIRGLSLGADDYLTKPFGTGELLARMRVALRHANDGPAVTSPSIVVGELRLDVDSRRVFVKDREVHLTPIEYKLFTVLMKNAGKVLTHRQLLKDVWGPSHVDQTQSLRVYMVQLRHKLEEEPARPRYLLTEPGVGYRLREQP